MTTTLKRGRVKGPSVHLIHPGSYPLCEWATKRPVPFIPFEGDATCQHCLDLADQIRISDEIVAELVKNET